MSEEDKVQLPEKIQNGLEQLLEELSIKNYKLEMRSGSAKGDNFLGVVVKVKVESYSGTLHLIVKHAMQGDMRKYFQLDTVFRREVYMYEMVFPELLKLQEKLNVKDIFYPFARMYKSSLEPPFEYLIMEDMTSRGFFMKNKRIYPDLKHCELVMDRYGKYHALCLALKQKNFETYDTLLENTREEYFIERTFDELTKTVTSNCVKIINSLNEDVDRELIGKLERFKSFPKWGLRNNLSPENAGGIVVFCHGDCWSNNLLYKYKREDDQSNPTDVCILDWQLSRCASPAVDLGYFLFVSTDVKTRLNHYDKLLKTYHASLTDCLDRLGCDSSIFTFDDLNDHMRKFSLYGLMMTMIVAPLLLMESNDILDWEDLPDDDRLKLFRPEKNDEVTTERLKYIVKDFDRFGNFDG